MNIFNNTKKYHCDPILTFDQPLYKAYEIQWKESGDSELKGITLRLIGLHTCMSFLGSLAHF